LALGQGIAAILDACRKWDDVTFGTVKKSLEWTFNQLGALSKLIADLIPPWMKAQATNPNNPQESALVLKKAELERQFQGEVSRLEIYRNNPAEYTRRLGELTQKHRAQVQEIDDQIEKFRTANASGPVWAWAAVRWARERPARADRSGPWLTGRARRVHARNPFRTARQPVGAR
jgi:hypothetical protein